MLALICVRVMSCDILTTLTRKKTRMWGNMEQGEDMKISCILEIPALIGYKTYTGNLIDTYKSLYLISSLDIL